MDFGYYISFKLIDKGVLEWLGPMGLYSLVFKISKSVIALQTGIIYNYALFMFVGFIMLVGLAMFGYLIPSASLLFVILMVLSLILSKVGFGIMESKLTNKRP